MAAMAAAASSALSGGKDGGLSRSYGVLVVRRTSRVCDGYDDYTGIAVGRQASAFGLDRMTRDGDWGHHEEHASGHPGHRPRVDRVVVRTTGRDLHIGFKVREV